MSRYTSEGSYKHSCHKIKYSDAYEITWTVDFYYSGSRLRFPRRFGRITNKRGAKIFCKKHNIPFEDMNNE